MVDNIGNERMSIDTKLEGDDLKINIVDLLSSLSGEQEQQLIEQLSCSNTIIKHVSDQIIHGLTEGGYSGWESSGHEPTTPLSVAKREVSKASGDIARDTIKELEKECKTLAASYDEYRIKYYDLKNKR